jgi:hypothetical protein
VLLIHPVVPRNIAISPRPVGRTERHRTMTNIIRIETRRTTSLPACPTPPRLLDRVRDIIRRKHYSIRTEQAYVRWIRRFILFHGKRHPTDMGAPEVEAFLTHLAVAGKVAASTQNQALNALVFLYREVLAREIGWLEHLEHAKRPTRVPVVFSRDEAKAVLARLDGVPWLMASLLYGCETSTSPGNRSW